MWYKVWEGRGDIKRGEERKCGTKGGWGEGIYRGEKRENVLDFGKLFFYHLMKRKA